MDELYARMRNERTTISHDKVHIIFSNCQCTNIYENILFSQHGPRALAVTTEGKVLACYKQHHELKVHEHHGEKVSTIPLQYYSIGHIVTIENPRGMATDDEGNIYITDSQSHKLHKFNKDGIHQGSTKGCGKNFGELHSPKGVAIVDSYVFVCDLFNQRVQCFNCDLHSLYAIYILKKSNLCPINITCGGRRNPTTLYITGTNRIYVCELSGDLRKPDKAEVRCSVLQYKDGETDYKFQRIGGISVIEKEGQCVQLIISETFQNSVLVLNLNHEETDGNNHNTPTLHRRYPDSHPKTCTDEPTQQTKVEFPIVMSHGENADSMSHGENADPKETILRKPHPVTVHGNTILVSTDDDECGIKKYTLE